MEFLISMISVIFVALLVGAALMFGFVLLAWFTLVVMVFTAFMLVRNWYIRRFHREATPRQSPPVIVDVEFKDISE